MELSTIAEILLAIIAVAKIVNGIFKIDRADSIIEAVEKVIKELISVFKIEVDSEQDKK